MAGWGSRLRPHTLTIPKPMLPIAGKSIVQSLVEGLVQSSDQKIEDIVFIIRADFGKAIETELLALPKMLVAKATSDTRMFRWAPRMPFCAPAIFWKEM